MSSLNGIVPHNFTLPAVSGSWIYSPGRDTDLGWTAAYTGTPDIDDSINKEGRGHLYFATQTAKGTTITLDFTGIGLSLCIFANGAKYQLAVDGIVPAPTDQLNDPQCRDMGASSTISTGILAQGLHRAEITILEASPASAFRFYGGFFTANLDVGDAADGVLIEHNVDDLDRSWAYLPELGAGEWDYMRDEPLAHHRTRTFNCHYAANVTATLRFSGANSLVLWGLLYGDTHYYSVQLDDEVFNADASTSLWRVGSAPLFVRAGLDPGKTYTLTYRNFNELFPDCTNGQFLGRNGYRTCCASLDQLQLFGSGVLLDAGKVQPGTPVTRKSTTSTSVPTSRFTPAPSQSPRPVSSSSLAAIICGVLGGILGICLLTLALFWRHCRGRRPESELGRSAKLASEDGESATTESGAIQPWMESLQGNITAFHPPPAPSQSFSQGEKTSGWAVKPLASEPHPRQTVARPSALAGTSAVQPNPSGLPLRPSDLRRILAYVAGRMDSPRPAASERSTLPPSYE